MQFFRQVHHDCPITAFNGREGEFVQYPTGLRDGNQALLALDSDHLIQLVLKEIRIFQQEIPPLPGKLVRNQLVLSGNRKDKVDVRMDEFPHPRVVSVQFIQEPEDQREGTAPVILMEQHGMRNPSLLHHLVKSGPDLSVSLWFPGVHPSF